MVFVTLTTRHGSAAGVILPGLPLASDSQHTVCGLWVGLFSPAGHDYPVCHASADDGAKSALTFSFFSSQNCWILQPFSESRWEMQSNKYKHVWYWFSNVVKKSLTFENFARVKTFFNVETVNGYMRTVKLIEWGVWWIM